MASSSAVVTGWQRWLALPTLLAVLGLVVVATRALAVAPSLAPVGGKSTRAERAMVYELTAERGPRFRLAGGAEVVQLLVHLELPTGGAADAVYRFAVAATLRGPDGAVLWERTVTQRARQTKAGERAGGWDYEAAFVVDGGVELSDAARVELALPDVPPGSALELQLGADTGVVVEDGVQAFARPTALVRAYRRQVVDAAERELRRLALAGSGERRLPETFLPWYALAAEQQERRLAAAWERLAAEGRAGVDYRVRSIYVAPSRPPALADTPVPALAVAAGQPLVLQLAGAGTVWIEAWAPGGTNDGGTIAGERSATVRVRLREVAEDVSGDRSDVPEDRSAVDVLGDRLRVVETREVAVVPAGRAEISVPPGWWSLEVETDLPAALVQVRADAASRHAGAEDHAIHGAWAGRGGAAEELGALVPVDVSTLPVYALGPGAAPLPVTLAPGDEPEARFVRVMARAWGRLAPVTVRYSFVDAVGAVLASGEHAVDTLTAAPFDRLRSEAVVEDGMRAPVVFPLGEAPVSEPVGLGLIAPAGAVRIVVSTDEPALVAVHGQLPVLEEKDGASPWAWPYDQVVDPRIRWRHAPRVRPRTFPRRAEDHAERAAAGQVRAIVAQVRAEEVDAADAVVGPWRAEQPRGSHTRLRLLEEVPAARRRAALAAWGPGSYTRLRAGSAATLDLTRGLPRPARLRYQVTGAALDMVGESLELTVDGERAAWPVATRVGQRGLPRRATSLVSWSGPSGLAVLANRPPIDGGGRLYEHRQVHQLSAGGLTVGLDKPASGTAGMNVVVYWLDGSREPAKLELEVDGGSPRRRSGTPVNSVMAARRTIEVAPERTASAIFPDRRGETQVGIGRAALMLGDDLTTGQHAVRVRHVGGAQVWVRFFRAGKAEARRGAWQWSERRTTEPRAKVVEEADADE